jgi:hypothetical protein
LRPAQCTARGHHYYRQPGSTATNLGCQPTNVCTSTRCHTKSCPPAARTAYHTASAAPAPTLPTTWQHCYTPNLQVHNGVHQHQVRHQQHMQRHNLPQPATTWQCKRPSLLAHDGELQHQQKVQQRDLQLSTITAHHTCQHSTARHSTSTVCWPTTPHSSSELSCKQRSER